MASFDKNATVKGAAGQAIPHESALKHVTGEAVYVDDQFVHQQQLHAAVGKSAIAHGLIKRMDLSLVEQAEGVVAVITAADIPGHNEVGPVFDGDPMLADSKVEYAGQPIFAVAATSHDMARRAAQLAVVEYETLAPVLDVNLAAEQAFYVRPPHQLARGDAEGAIAASPHRLSGQIAVGGQEHFYIEGQVSSVVPTEDGGMQVYTSSQHPAEIAATVAEVLGVPIHKVVADVRRMGGAFGGKEAQAAQWACIAAVLARKTRRPVKLRLSRSDDMMMTGKRHPFSNHYCVGFNDDGRLNGIDITLNADGGYSPDLTDAVVDRAMLDLDNAYYLNQSRVIGNRCKTHKVSNTAFRGFGGPQSVATIEWILDDIARHLGVDPLEVRKANLYGVGARNTTHYHHTLEHNVLPELISQLEQSSEYWRRREAVSEFNRQNRVLKKGLALTPVKFGISFALKRMNQAGALVHVYTDGSIHLNHGGTEMGQGLFTRVAQIVAEEFQVDIDRVQVSATRTDKVPNSSPTAGSTGTDLNGKAAQNAARMIKHRLVEFAARHFEVAAEQVVFSNNRVQLGERELAFEELISLAYNDRIQLSAAGFYKTPDIDYQREKAAGRPYYYYTNCAAVSEVLIDTLTGETKVLRADILFDAGRSINPALDIGQIEGGFIQGMGWVTTEELKWDDQGRLLSNNPATYKIPAISDTPLEFNVELMANAPNESETVYRSKGVSEPPVLLGLSVLAAIRDVVSSLADYRVNPRLDPPATPECVLAAVRQLQQREV